MNKIKLVATDLDGTFLKNDRTISNKNLKALEVLGENSIVRVAATGRNLQKVKDVLNSHVPFDYIVYSSGAGVFDWNKQLQIYNQNIGKESVEKLLKYFIQQKLNFHAFFPAPENHKHWYCRGNYSCEEFERYFEFNRSFAIELDINNLPDSEMCQFLIIIPENESRFSELKKEVEALSSQIRVIRSSSPITPGYIWVEVFHQSVSKGNGIKHICEMLKIEQKRTFGIGNDYNDFDLLEYTEYSYLTENAPLKIRNAYPQVPSNENDAFAFATQLIFR